MIIGEFLGNNDIFSKVFVTKIGEVCDEIRYKDVTPVNKKHPVFLQNTGYFTIKIFLKKLQIIWEYVSIENRRYTKQESPRKNLEALYMVAVRKVALPKM